jgi:hypothetical protein
MRRRLPSDRVIPADLPGAKNDAAAAENPSVIK